MDIPSDVFVSYARVDDLHDESLTPKGWVTALIERLKYKLAQKLGREGDFAVWRDIDCLTRHEPFPSQIEAAVQSSHALVIVLSSSYLRSEWCSRELKSFLESHGPGARSRVFVIERDEAARIKRPAELHELLGYQFWTKSGRVSRTMGDPYVDKAKDAEYFDALEILSTELSEALRAGDEEPDVRPLVYVAWTTDDLTKLRREVIQYLRQAGVRVVPEKPYPLQREAYERACRADCAKVSLFAQLVSDATGLCPPDVPEGFPALQLALAGEAKLRVFRWRPAEVKPEEADTVIRPLLNAPGMFVEGIESFKDRLVDAALNPVLPEPPWSPEHEAPLVFVNYEEPDCPLGDAIEQALRNRGRVDISLPFTAGTPKEQMDALQTTLRTCDTMLCVYGRASPAWVHRQLNEARRVVPLRGSGFLVLGVYQDEPTPPKPELGLHWRNLKILGKRRPFDPVDLDDFIQAVQGEARSHEQDTRVEADVVRDAGSGPTGHGGVLDGSPGDQGAEPRRGAGAALSGAAAV